MTLPPDVLPRFSLLVLSAVVFAYFAVRARTSRGARWLAVALLGFTLHQTAFVGLDMSRSEAALSVFSGLTWSSALLAAWAFLGVALGLFANGLTRSGRRTMGIAGVLAAGAAVYAHLGYGPLIGYVTALSVQIVGGAATMVLMGATAVVLVRRRRTVDGPRADARRLAYRTFIAVVATGFVIPVVRALSDAGLVSSRIDAQVALVAWALVMLGLVTLYVNYDREPTSVVVKAVAFAFLSVVAALGVGAEILFPDLPPGASDAARQAQGERAFAYAGLIVGAGVFVLAAFPLFLRESLTRPLGRLLDGVRRAARGSLDADVPVGARDEVGRLTEDFNRMTGALRTAETELRRYADELEDRVQARTAELAASLDELKAAQARLVQQEKLASLGQLTAGIAHEIKNPLNFVTNFADLTAELVQELEDEDDPDEQEAILSDLRSNVERIGEHGRRADAIVKGMMAHARGGGGTPETIDLDALVSEYAALALHGLRARVPGTAVALVQDLGGVGLVRAVPGDLGRVLVNLLDNAFDAVGDGGEVRVSTLRREGQAEVRVADQGVGMPEDVRARVFEPFFTTKPTGQGTGLGLSLAYDIVTQGHGGTLAVESAEGQGSTFAITLPSAPRPAGRDAPPAGQR